MNFDTLSPVISEAFKYTYDGLGNKIIILFVLNLILLFAIKKNNAEFRFQHYILMLLLIIMNILIMIEGNTLFVISFFLFIITYLVSSYKYFYSIYIEYTLQKKHKLKFKHIQTETFNAKNIDLKKVSLSNLSYIFDVGLGNIIDLYIQKMENRISELQPYIIMIAILLLIDILLIYVIIFLSYQSMYFLK